MERRWLISAGVTTISALLVVSIWAVAEQRDRAGAQRLVDVAAREGADRLSDFVKARLEQVELVEREREAGLLRTREEFALRAGLLLEELGGFQAINWIDGNGVIVWVVPDRGNAAAAGRNVHQHPLAAPMLEEAARSREKQVTGPVRLFQGMTGFAAYFPVVVDGELVGFVNAVFRIDELVEQCLGHGLLAGYAARIQDGTPIVYESAGFAEAAEELSSAAEVRVDGRDWTLVIAPRPDLLEDLRGGPFDALLGVGLALALLLGVIAHRAVTISDRQRELARELEHARRMEAIGRVASGIAHDFNNLITAILTQADLVRRQAPDDPEIVESVEGITQAAKSAGRVTKQLLTFARNEPRPARAPTSIAETVERMHETLSALVPPSVELRLAMHGDCIADVDGTEVERILTNLVTNAVDAMPDGGAVSVDVHEDGDEVLVTVADNGVGMPPDVKERAFEPFFSTKRGHGSGLGLANVYGLVTKAGGRVSLESSVGRGTRIEARFPRSRLHG